MCIRGDQESLTRTAFPSAPTVSREMLKVGISAFVNDDRMVCAMVDISQAFIQSDLLSMSERMVAIPRTCMSLNGEQWTGAVSVGAPGNSWGELIHPPSLNMAFSAASHPNHEQCCRIIKEAGHPNRKWAFLAQRPLYGSRDAPLRWLFKD